MNAEVEQTWRDLVADAAEQKRRAELFPALVHALDELVSESVRRTPAQRYAIALLVRCRKPVQP